MSGFLDPFQNFKAAQHDNLKFLFMDVIINVISDMQLIPE